MEGEAAVEEEAAEEEEEGEEEEAKQQEQPQEEETRNSLERSHPPSVETDKMSTASCQTF